MQIKKREGPVDVRYEEMPDGKFFSLFKNDYASSGGGLNMEKSIKEKTPEVLKQEWEEFAKRYYQISNEKTARLIKYMTEWALGLHVLTELVNDDEVTDIKVYSDNNIWFKKRGRRYRSDVQFESPQDLKTFMEMLAVRNGINIGKANSIRNFTDKKTCPEKVIRFTIFTDSVNDSEKPSMHMRISSKKKRTMEDLIACGMLDEKMASYIQSRMRQGYLLISGRNASGKTSLEGALLDKYTPEESVLVIQENQELIGGELSNQMFLHTVEHKGDQKNSIGLKELVIYGQMIDVDHIVIGEIKGEEAMYFITAALTGCKGMATIHSEDAKGALEKMSDYCKWGSDYSRNEIMKLLSCVKTIVYMENFKVQEIAVNHGFDEKIGENQLEVVFDRDKGVNLI